MSNEHIGELEMHIYYASMARDNANAAMARGALDLAAKDMVQWKYFTDKAKEVINKPN